MYWTHLNPHGQIVSECSEVWCAVWIAEYWHESESHRESDFIARVINTCYIIQNIVVVAEHELQCTECLVWKDRNLPVLIQVICSCQEEQLEAVECRQSNRHHNRQHHEHVWSTRRVCCKWLHIMETRQVVLVGNGPSLLQCEQSANHFTKDSRKLRTTWIRISENPDCPMKTWSFQIRRWRCFAKMKRVLMWDPLRTETAIKHGKPSWEHEQLGMQQTLWISYWNQHSRHETHASIFDNSTKNAEEYANGWTRKWWDPKGSLHEQNCTTGHATAFDVESVPFEHGWRGCPGYCRYATVDFSRDDKGRAGFIAPVVKGPVKGGKPCGVPYNFGESSGTKGKGKMHKGSGF